MSADWSLSQARGGGSLYSSHYRGSSGVNPSINGDHIHGEVTEAMRWANQYLGVGGYSDHLITDLAHDMADGITLIRLVQALSDSVLPKHNPNPMIRVHKLENIQKCLDFLKQEGVQISAIHADNIVGENKKSILGLCHALRRHYTAGPSPKSNRNPRGQFKFNFSSLDKDDVAILSWLGSQVSRDIADYTALYDGRVLCELMNEIEDGAIDPDIIYNGTSKQRLELALSTGQTKFFISRGSLSVAKIATGSEDSKLKSYLQQCKLVYQQSVNQRGTKTSTLTRLKRRGREKVRQEERMKSSSSSLESREAAKIASRTYEGLQQRKVANGEPVALHSSHGNLQTTTQPHSSKRPLSDIYVSGASSFTDLLTTRSEHAEMVTKYNQPRQISKHSSADTLDGSGLGRHHSMEPFSHGGGRTRIPPLALGSSWPRQSSGYDSDTNSAMSTSSTLLRSHSQGSLPGEGGTLGVASYGGMFTSRSLTRSIESVNTPTFDLPGRSNSATFRRTPSYSRLDSGSSTAITDELTNHVADLEERISLLTMQFIYERHDMFKQIHAALVKERRRRQALEKRTKEMERLSKQLVKQYDARFIELASEVSKLRGELLAVGRGKSTPAPSVTMEIQQLKEQVSKLLDNKNKNVGPVLQFPKRTSKQNLFMRKRASSDLTSQSNPSNHHRQIRSRGRSVAHQQQSPSPLPPASPQNQKPTGPFLLGSTTSFKKLSNFFGEEPPRLQNLRSFLEDLGYLDLLPVFDANEVTLAELSCMSDAHLSQLGVPLGQRVRILKEVQQLQPLDANDVI